MRRAGLVLSIIGAVILLVSVIGGVALALAGFGTVRDQADSAVPIIGSGQVTVEEGDRIQLYAPEDQMAPACTVMTEANAPATAGITQSSSFSSGGETWESFYEFQATSSGVYTVECDSDSPVVAAPPVSLGGIFGGLGGIALGVLGGGFGLLMLILGLILFFVGRSRMNRADAASAEAAPMA